MTVQTVRSARSLLLYGVLAGPFYVTVSLAQALTRDGFELNKHAWSLLENGSLGWIQRANLIITGLMVVAAAAGLRRALIGVYGLSLVGAGIFTADPAQGFPAGTPESTTVSWHGMLHFAVGGVGFLCLVIACLRFGSWFAGERRTGLAWFSRVTGVVFLAAFAGIASGSHGPATLTFVVAVLLSWAWLSTVCLYFHQRRI
jgi:hypothetical membrane protein